MTPAIDWQASAAPENVPRGDSELAQVSSLADAVRTWTALDGKMQAGAVLTPERPMAVDDGKPVAAFAGMAIRTLAELLED